MTQLQEEAKTDIRGATRKFVSDNFVLRDGPDSLKDDDSFLEKGIVDSTGVLELVSFIEETFCIEVKDEELIPDNLDSVNKVTSYVERKLSQA